MARRSPTGRVRIPYAEITNVTVDLVRGVVVETEGSGEMMLPAGERRYSVIHEDELASGPDPLPGDATTDETSGTGDRALPPGAGDVWVLET